MNGGAPGANPMGAFGMQPWNGQQMGGMQPMQGFPGQDG